MSTTVTFTSPISPTAFTGFTLQSADRQALEVLRDEGQVRYGLSFIGNNLKASYEKLAPIAVVNLLNGAPSMTLDGHLVAAAIGQGALVQVAVTGGPTRVGIITNLVWQVGRGGGFGQRLDFVLHRCHRLHVRSGGSVTTSTDPAVS